MISRAAWNPFLQDALITDISSGYTDKMKQQCFTIFSYP